MEGKVDKVKSILHGIEAASAALITGLGTGFDVHNPLTWLGTLYAAMAAFNTYYHANQAGA
jgi:hypothetical protein